MTEARYYAQIETRKTGRTGVYENDMTNWFAIYEVGVQDPIEFHKLPYKANRNSAETLRELGWELYGELDYIAAINVERGPVRRIKQTEETTAAQKDDEYEPSSEAAIAAARIALEELKAKGWKANPIYWVGRLEAALEQTLKAIDKQDGCTHHNIKDRRGGRALELGTIPACEPGITYGAWSEGAGGFVYSGVDCATDAANWAADELRELAKEDDTDKFEILAICPDHEEQPKNGCEECNEEAADEEETDEADEIETEAAPTLEDVELPSDEADREQARREAKQGPEPSLDDYAKASRIIQGLIPGVRH